MALAKISLHCILKANISPESLVAKSIIKYHMMSNNFKSYAIEITEPVVEAFKSGSQKYSIRLDDKRKNSENSELEIRAMHIHIVVDIEKIRVTQDRRQQE